LLLARNLGVAPRDIVFMLEVGGRPALVDDNRLSFNLSHSAGVAALAVSTDVPVGVDIEEIRPIAAHEIMWALSPAECLELSMINEAEQLESFFRFWTLKEALMKGTGLGARLALHDFDTSLLGPRLVRMKGKSDAAAQWTFCDTAPKAGMRGAVAARTGGRALAASWTWVQLD